VIVAAHQPSYLPWLGYLDKIAKADLFVVMDDLQYEAQNYQNRNRIKLNNGASWVTVPLLRGSQNDLIIDKLIDNSGNPKQHWQRKTWVTLKMCYGKAPHFARYAAELEDLFTRPWERLVDLDLHVLELARTWLGITRPIVRSSTLGLTGQKTERIIDMCQKVGAKVYLSGSGGSTGYLDEAAFERAGITLMWQRFAHPTYPQRYPDVGFVPNLAFLDLLLNCGPESRDILWTKPVPKDEVAFGLPRPKEMTP
jgi:WbqC-like protein family